MRRQKDERRKHLFDMVSTLRRERIIITCITIIYKITIE